MKTIYEIQKEKLIETESTPKNFWIHLESPTKEELEYTASELKIKQSDLEKALDKSELPHMENEENYFLVILHTPVKQETSKQKYRVYPIGLFFLKNGIISISSEETSLSSQIEESISEKQDYQNPNFYPIYLISKNTSLFLKYLNEIREEILQKEKNLLKASNKELDSMLNLQKSLLYFTTSLQGNRTILERLENSHSLSSIEQDFLKDGMIELKQALEMTNIYQEILENIMNTYHSMISNNTNDIMKFLTSITLVISIPTMVSSFLGMNVYLGEFGKNPYSFLLIILISLLITVLLLILLKKKNML